VARDLEALGVIVKRQNTITSTETVTTDATTTDISVTTSIIYSTYTALSTTTAIRSSTVFRNAETTVEVTSTVTREITTSEMTTSSSTTADEGTGTSSPNAEDLNAGNGGDEGLSTGEEVGIGVGTAGGSIIICIILIFFWRRRRKEKKTEPRTPSPDLPANKSEMHAAPAVTQRQSYRSGHSNYGQTSPAYSYEPVDQSYAVTAAEAPGHESHSSWSPQQQQPTQFQYAPYELYDERPQEAYHDRYERDLGISEADSRR
jgi:hypothetical protein